MSTSHQLVDPALGTNTAQSRSPASSTPPVRADALDALRGLAVLMMVFSGVVPRAILPAWMYHAQLPPPTHAFNPQLPGLTWVDLVFPIFLFSMGAAMPLAMTRRLAQGWGLPKLIGSILQRGLFLSTFAIVLQHVRPYTLNPEPTTQTWWLALLGFVVLFAMFLRLPGIKLGWQRDLIMVVTWCVGALFLMQLHYPDGSGFSLNRSDIILLVLANMAVVGSLIWVLTRSRPELRIACMGLLLALRLSSTEDGWVASLWQFSPAPWLFRWDYLKYLFIVIPGTIAGDQIQSWLHSLKTKGTSPQTWLPFQFFSVLVLTIVISVAVVAGLQARLLWQTTLVAILLAVSGLELVAKPVSAMEWLLHQLYHWGCYWLTIGLILEPFENGIKKDASTLSYYFVTTGIALFLLIALTTIVHVFSQKIWVQVLIDNGLNPMLGYMGIANLVLPIFSLVGWDDRLIAWATTPSHGLVKGLVYTLTLAGIVSLCTRLKLLLRT